MNERGLWPLTNVIDVGGRQIRVQGRLLRIARLDAEKYFFLNDPEPVLRGLRERGGVDIFTFMQRLPDSQPKYGYPMEGDNLAAVPVTTFENWLTKQIDRKTRNKAKQAEKKGVTTREVPFGDELAKGIWEVYNECPVRQGKPFRHYGKGLKEVYDAEATFLEHSFFIGAFFEERLIGFVKILADENRQQAGLLNILSMIAHRDKAVTNALIAHAVRACAERGIPYLVYSNFAYGNKAPDSLAEFKSNNGFERFDVPRYYVPLTVTGRAALRFGFHHRFMDRLPEALGARLRGVRKQWYDRKQLVAAPDGNNTVSEATSAQ